MKIQKSVENILHIFTKYNAFGAIAIVFCLAAFSFAQSGKEPKRGIYPTGSYSLSDIETVNTTNGNLMFNIPLGSLPAGRGGNPGAGIGLIYNSQEWNPSPVMQPDASCSNCGEGGSNTTHSTQTYLEPNDNGGWRYNVGYKLEVIDRRTEYRAPYGGNVSCRYNPGTYQYDNATFLIKVRIKLPDGSVRYFRRWNAGSDRDGYSNYDPEGRSYTQCVPDYTNAPPYMNHMVITSPTYAPQTYYSFDGSHLRLDISFSAPDTNGFRTRYWKLSYPDGNRVESASANAMETSYTVNKGYNAPYYVYDRNGNVVTTENTTYNGHSATRITDGVGRSITIEYGAAPSEDYIHSTGSYGEPLITKVRWKSIAVNKTYLSGRPTSYFNTTQQLNASIPVVDQIIPPTQINASPYVFGYNLDPGATELGWGEVSSITLPSGAQAKYVYQYDGQNGLYGSLVTNNPLTSKQLIYQSEYDNSSDTEIENWSYEITRNIYEDQVNPATESLVTMPNGKKVRERYYRVDNPEDPLNGMTLSTEDETGTITERIWDLNNVVIGTSPRFNPYVKTEFVSVRDSAGNLSKTAIKDYQYDQNGNLTEIKEYDWVSYSTIPRNTNPYGTYEKPIGIPANAPLKRKTVNTYYNPTPYASSTDTSSPNGYWNASSPALRSLAKSTETQTSGGTPVSRAEMYYDYTTYATNTKGGNLTETRVWDSVKQETLQNPDVSGYRLDTNNSIKTTASYDQNGNPTSTTDARGVVTTITYACINGQASCQASEQNLYPTKTEAASNHASLKRTSTVEYDFSTGLATKATDVDNSVSTETGYDAVGRPEIVKTAVNTSEEVWAQTFYDDAARRVIVKSDIEIKGDGRQVAVQFFDQLGRVRLTKTLEDAATQSATNETDGVKVQTRYLTDNPYSYQLTSNPYRAPTSAGASNEPQMGWTMTKTANTGRSSEVETFSGPAVPQPFGGNNTNSTGVVKTDIDADRTLVTDQAGKKRISRTNGLGQLTDVWEITAQDASTLAVIFPNQPGVTHGYQTSYEYNTLNNLTKVIQGTQQQNRTFSYTSLSRLKTAFNPESGTIQYQYDNNGNLTSKTDARGIITNYIYDGLNRVTQRSYANEPNGQAATPTVTYTYDNVTNAKGQLTKVSSDVSETSYTAFDKLGRVTTSVQRTPFTDTETIATAAARTSAYKYNLAGALIEQTYPSTRVVKNVLDAGGDLSVVESKKSTNAGFWNYAQQFTYTAAGGVSSVQLGNGTWESTTFNSRLQPTQIALGSVQNGFDKLKLNYTYNTTGQNDNTGNVLSQTITVPALGTSPTFTAVQTYTYDQLNRIKDAKDNINGSSTPEWKQTFTYDRYGNRTFNEAETTTLPKNCLESGVPAVCATDRAAVNPSVSTTNNRLTDYTYDNAGNTKIDALSRQFTYDAGNKQTEVKDQYGNTMGQYFYDGDGKRVKKKVGTETTIFVYDASGKLIAEYSTVVEPVETAKVSYLTSDHLGSPRITADKDGEVISRRDFMPFGEEISTSQRTARTDYAGDKLRQKFTGYERDSESDLDYAQARYYDLKHGRFTTVDPLMASARTIRPESWNRYVYCWNNPLALVDRDGMDVQLLDKKARERVLSTLPEKLRKQVEKQIDKKGLLKKGALDKINSKDANFLDLKSAVDAKGTIEVVTGNKDPRNGEAFFYKSDAEERKELVEGLIKTGSTPEEARKEANELLSDPDRERRMGLGVTLSPTDKGNPNSNWRVVLSDGTGDASDAPQSTFAEIAAEELYGHALPGIQGKPWKHEYNNLKDPPEPTGPVDANIIKIRERTRNLYKKP